MQAPVLEADRRVERDLGFRPAGKAAIARNAENKISVATPHDALKDGKGCIGEGHNILDAVLGPLFRYRYGARVKIDFGPSQTADFLAPAAGQQKQFDDIAIVVFRCRRPY